MGKSGLSPRGRGKQTHISPSLLPEGSIPAWAGETPLAVLAKLEDQVYPRVGGGNPEDAVKEPVVLGLSPRGRGKRSKGKGKGKPSGSIPAWAGETLSWVARNRPLRVYPRVGGGNPPA